MGSGHHGTKVVAGVGNSVSQVRVPSDMGSVVINGGVYLGQVVVLI